MDPSLLPAIDIEGMDHQLARDHRERTARMRGLEKG